MAGNPLQRLNRPTSTHKRIKPMDQSDHNGEDRLSNLQPTARRRRLKVRVRIGLGGCPRSTLHRNRQTPTMVGVSLSAARHLQSNVSPRPRASSRVDLRSLSKAVEVHPAGHHPRGRLIRITKGHQLRPRWARHSPPTDVFPTPAMMVKLHQGRVRLPMARTAHRHRMVPLPSAEQIKALALMAVMAGRRTILACLRPSLHTRNTRPRRLLATRRIPRVTDRELRRTVLHHQS